MIINIEIKTRGSTVSHPQEKKSNLLTRQGKVLFLVVEISDSGLEIDIGGLEFLRARLKIQNSCNR